MTINYFHVMGIAFWPAETNTPLIVYTDAVSPHAIAEKFFQAVSWGNPQIRYLFCCIKQKKLSKGYSLNVCRQLR
jgi:hypothetical protein